MNRVLALIVASMCQSALAQDRPGGDCALATGPNLQGQMLTLSHLAKEGDGFTLAGKINAEPASAFVADGYALKVFTEPYFAGDGYLLGSPSDLDGYYAVTGGHYVNIDAKPVLGQVQSYACVKAGSEFPRDQAGGWPLSRQIPVYYNGTIFTEEWFHGNHPGKNTAQITYQDGQKLVRVRTEDEGGNSREFVWDLDSRNLVVTSIQVTDGNKGSVTETIDFRPGDFTHPQFAYIGVLTLMKASVRALASGLAGKQEKASYPPRLELQPLLRVLKSETADY